MPGYVPKAQQADKYSRPGAQIDLLREMIKDAEAGSRTDTSPMEVAQTDLIIRSFKAELSRLQTLQAA